MQPAHWKTIAIVSTTAAVLMSLLLLPACCCVTRSPVSTAPAVPSRIPQIGTEHIPTPDEAAAKRPTEAEMQNVKFHIDEVVVMNIHQLRGQMIAKEGPAHPVNFDNKTEFVLKIDTASVGLNSTSLDGLMNRYVFKGPGSPLRDLHITVENGQLRQEGIMHKIVDIPFTMLAGVSATEDGRIRLHPSRVDICGINGLKLLKALGTSMSKLLDLSKVNGVVAEGNDLILDPLKILPPPQIEGRLTDVRVEGGEMLQTFDAGMKLPDLQPPGADPNYMYFRGGTLRMGKLLMVDADMHVVDTDPSDPFDFFIDRYNDELVQGFSRNQPNYALVVHMRDFEDVGLPCRPGEHGFCGSSQLATAGSSR